MLWKCTDRIEDSLSKVNGVYFSFPDFRNFLLNPRHFSDGKARYNILFHTMISNVLRGVSLKTFPNPLTPDEEKYYFQKYTEGDLEAKHILIERNLRLVAHIVRKYQNLGEEMEDLISIGTIGLIKAVISFDPEKGNRLAAYASRCVEKATPSLRLHFAKKRKKTHLFQHGKFIDNSENNFAFFIRNNMADLYIRFSMSMTLLSRFPHGFLLLKNICLSILLPIV